MMNKAVLHSPDEYKHHEVFDLIKYISEYYSSLSFNSIGKLMNSTLAFDGENFIIVSISETLNSIYDVLNKGRINDAFALLRKYYDSIVIHVYIHVFLEENAPNEIIQKKINENKPLDVNDLIVEPIQDWIDGKGRLPKTRQMVQYIIKSKSLKKYHDVMDTQAYINIRTRCNANMHYSSYANFMLNDGKLLWNRIPALDRFQKDLIDLFIWHFVYIVAIAEYLIMSSDYLDYLEVGMTPEEGSQYWVAPFVQEAFKNIIKPYSEELSGLLVKNISMKLE
jgi:hypothetical protein